MARNFAPIYTAIWQDRAFRALTGAAQRMYLLLVSQPDISAAGTLSLTVRRWAAMAADTDPKTVGGALRELVDAGFIAADQTTEELLVRSFVRWDKAYGNPKRRPAILAAAGTVGSAALRRVLAGEFARVGLPVDGFDPGPDGVESHPDSHSGSHSAPAIAPAVKPQVNSHSDSHSDRHPDSHRFPVPVVGTSEVVGTQGSLAPAQPTPAPKAKRGTRIPENFTVTDRMRDWAAVKAPNIDVDSETEQFHDHWTAASGKGSTKLDWVAAWRTWMRNAVKFARPLPSNVVALRGPAVESPGSAAHFQRAMERARAKEAAGDTH